MTLRSRLFGAIGITLAVVLAVLVTVTVSLESAREDRRRELQQAALEFAASLAAKVPYEQYLDTQLLVDGRLHPSLSSLAVYQVDREGELQPLQRYGRIAADAELEARVLPLVREVRDENVAVRRFHRGSWVAAVPVARGRGEASGGEGRDAFAYLEFRPLALDTLAVGRVTFFVIVASGGLLLLLVWLIVDRVVARPLRDVVAAAQRVAEGDYSRAVPATGADDEIQTVVDAFNAMMLEIGMLHERMQDRIGEALRTAHRTQESLVIAQRLAATGTLAAGIAHEVNNPLGGMVNAVHALRTKEMTPERRDEYLELVEDGLRRIQETVAKILRFTPHRVAPQAVELSDVVRPALGLVRHRLDREGVAVEVHAPQEPVLVFGDFYELQQALLNVLINALDALEEAHRDAPRIEIHVTGDAQEARLLVRDNGVGMAPADVPRAFDLFFTTKEQGRGSGLGLATVHKILEDHGGRVVLTPRAGEGMDVTFVLPRLRPPGATVA